MALFRRKPDLPPDLHESWWAFLDCAQTIEAGRRVLLGTLPTGRVEPAPVAVGVEAMERALADCAGWMPAWKLPELADDWEDCQTAMTEARQHLDEVLEVAASTSELEELLEAVGDVVAPLDAFADAEQAWRRLWRPPEERPTTG